MRPTQASVRVLLSNDDGYQATGIRVLAEHLRPLAEVTVVAPELDRSGASNSLTLDSPIRATQTDDGSIAVNGTPTDCVHLAITGLLEQDPDIVISGINSGANLGDDVLYSGTVAAAMEGRFLGLPAIAISLAEYDGTHFETAARYAALLLTQLQSCPIPADTILNVNVPNRPWNEIEGIRVTRLGHRHKAEPVIHAHDPRGRDIYWVGPPGAEQDAGPGTDFDAVRLGFVSITPLQVDLTRYDAMSALGSWCESIPKTL